MNDMNKEEPTRYVSDIYKGTYYDLVVLRILSLFIIQLSCCDRFYAINDITLIIAHTFFSLMSTNVIFWLTLSCPHSVLHRLSLAIHGKLTNGKHFTRLSFWIHRESVLCWERFIYRDCPGKVSITVATFCSETRRETLLGKCQKVLERHHNKIVMWQSNVSSCDFATIKFYQSKKKTGKITWCVVIIYDTVKQ